MGDLQPSPPLLVPLGDIECISTSLTPVVECPSDCLISKAIRNRHANIVAKCRHIEDVFVQRGHFLLYIVLEGQGRR